MFTQEVHRSGRVPLLRHVHCSHPIPVFGTHIRTHLREELSQSRAAFLRGTVGRCAVVLMLGLRGRAPFQQDASDPNLADRGHLVWRRITPTVSGLHATFPTWEQPHRFNEAAETAWRRAQTGWSRDGSKTTKLVLMVAWDTAREPDLEDEEKARGRISSVGEPWHELGAQLTGPVRSTSPRPPSAQTSAPHFLASSFYPPRGRSPPIRSV